MFVGETLEIQVERVLRPSGDHRRRKWKVSLPLTTLTLAGGCWIGVSMRPAPP